MCILGEICFVHVMYISDAVNVLTTLLDMREIWLIVLVDLHA